MKEKKIKFAEKTFIVRYFDEDWNEAEDLRTVGSLTDALLSVSLWAKSRRLDERDDSLIVFTFYHNYPLITLEECDV